ncbi:hypothetical protein T265_02026 [Opisthorchis viverrini]|uniref:Uncharacterized protein n=1 Tax=Opisthorchis viverrini TaxID=6198 RepID=A0A075AIK5_OPIVI|nr:hypothetical protein T265_02026 [Opisthorchis viverrini]KER31794.1 hypothetical protein T265_02026 [Opisthorchis viverrini]
MVFNGDSTESFVYGILQLNVLHKGRLIFLLQFGFDGRLTWNLLNMSFTMLLSNRLCCTRPPNVSVATIF